MSEDTTILFISSWRTTNKRTGVN